MYQKINKIAENFFTKAQIFKYGFNFSPMYRRSTGRVISVSKDLLNVKIKIPISWKNKNYVGSIFGGSLFSATDPIYMIQLIHILGDNYVVWDKAVTIKFRRPARSNAFAEFVFLPEEINQIKQDVLQKKEIDFVKKLSVVSKDKMVFCELEKTIYIAKRSYYKEKRRQKNAKT